MINTNALNNVSLRAKRSNPEKDCFVAIAPRNDSGCDSRCKDINDVCISIKKTPYSALFYSVLFLLILPFCYAEEQITLTTYYPSPHGMYKELNAYHMKIGQTYSTSAFTCADDNLIVEGKVGIGRGSDFNIDPGAKLDVNGKVKMTEFQLNTAGVLPGAALMSTDTSGNAQWVNGVPIALRCRSVSGIPGERSYASCADDEVVTGGGGADNKGNTNGEWNWGNGWQCHNSGDICTAVAMCCKIE